MAETPQDRAGGPIDDRCDHPGPPCPECGSLEGLLCDRFPGHEGTHGGRCATCSAASEWR